MEPQAVLLWAISFISLFLSIFWILLLLSEENKFKNAKEAKDYPKVSIIVPAHNEEKVIKKTITSLLNLNYPKNKLQIIAINDDSTDNTLKRLKSIKDRRLRIINRHPGYTGKAVAVNKGMPFVRGQLVGVLDGDTPYISPDSLIYMVPHFDNPNVGAVIGSLKVWKPKNILEKLQWFEYLFVTLTRKLLASLSALYVTPGGSFSLFRKDILDKIGYFDEESLTEDLEMAMRLQYHKYDIISELKSITQTKVPNTFRWFHNQRIRWYRGWLHTVYKYRSMLFNREYGFLGMFQMPISTILPIFLISITFIIGYEILKTLYTGLLLLSVVNIKDVFFQTLHFKELALSVNPLIFPMAVVLVLGLFMLRRAQIHLKETWKYPVATLGYFIVYQIILSSYWLVALFYEVTRAKKKW